MSPLWQDSISYDIELSSRRPNLRLWAQGLKRGFCLSSEMPELLRDGTALQAREGEPAEALGYLHSPYLVEIDRARARMSAKVPPSWTNWGVA